MKQKTMTVYKVTYRHLSYGIAREDKKFCLSYSLYRTTLPKIGKIFTFATKQQAYKFYFRKSNDDNSVIIFEGTGTNPTRIKIIAEDLTCFGEEFWKSRKNKKVSKHTILPAPEGTVVVDSFTPTRQYSLSEFVKECAK